METDSASSIPWHVYAAGVATATISVTGYDASHNVLLSKTIDLSVLPAAPQNVSAAWNSDGTVTVTWTDASSISGSFTVLASDDGGETFNTVGAAAAGSSSLQVSGLDQSQSYVVEVVDSSATSGTAGATSTAFDLPANGSGEGSTSGSGATTGATPGLSVTAGSDPATSAILTWTYAANDPSTFELEMEDTDTGENFYWFAQGAAVGASGSASTNSPALIEGDTYEFRVRADHADGTVSDYSADQQYVAEDPDGGVGLTATVYNIPANTPDNSPHPPFPDSDGNNTVELQWTTIDPGDYVEVWVRGDAYSKWLEVPSNNGDNGWPTDNPDSSSGKLIGAGCAGPGHYQYRIFDQGVWSMPASVTVPHNDGSTGGGPMLNTDITGTSVKVTWQVPQVPDNGSLRCYLSLDDNDEAYSSFVWTQQNDQWDPYQYSNPPQYTFTNVSPGKHTITMMMDEGWSTAPDPQDSHSRAYFSNITFKVGDDQKPNAPQDFRAVYDPSVPGGQVRLAWQNSSNNETGFKVYRLDSIGLYVQVGGSGADQTTFLDSGLSSTWPWLYKVVAVNSAGESNPTYIKVFPIGGPDITGHLLAIRTHLFSFLKSLPPSVVGKLYAEFIPTVDWHHPISTLEQIWAMRSLWDIHRLYPQDYSISTNSGELPNGMHTVTVAGHVYQDDEVNYWLFGSIMAALGIPEAIGAREVMAWVDWQYNGDRLQNKLAWYYAGFEYSPSNNTLTNPAQFALRGVRPAPTATQRELSFNKMSWHISSYIFYSD